MALVGPRLGGGRRGGHDPWFESPVFWDLWDPFGSGTHWWDLEVDWRETDNAHIFRADLPGVRKEEVKVHVEDGNVLKICGERTKEQEDKNDIWHRVERGLGSFVRRLRLPNNANLDETKCSLKNGELTVTVPKKETEENTKNVRNINVV